MSSKIKCTKELELKRQPISNKDCIPKRSLPSVVQKKSYGFNLLLLKIQEKTPIRLMKLCTPNAI